MKRSLHPGRSFALVLILALASGAAACAPRVHDLQALAAVATLRETRSDAPATTHWPLPTEELALRLAWDDFIITAFEGAGAGVTGAKRLTLAFADGLTVKVKWKPVPPRTVDGWNNSPRKEIAAYVIQQWFLEPQDWVVPPTVLRCIPLETYREHDATVVATIPDTQCVLGTLTVWLANVEIPDALYDEQRFWSDPVYAYHLANFNLLTYLIRHRDGRAGNFLTSTDPRNRRVFAVDNGIAFDSRVYNFLVPNWKRIRVPALDATAVEALRRVTPADVEALGVLVEMRADGLGLLQPVTPGPNLAPERGARVDPHGIVQLGLTADECEDLWDRIEALLEEIPGGTVSRQARGPTAPSTPAAAGRQSPRPFLQSSAPVPPLPHVWARSTINPTWHETWR
jgi:hypothetical protein